MRTTIDLTAEAYHLAKAVARERNASLGTVVSEFILQPVPAAKTGARGQKRRSAAGFPVFSSGKRVTSDDVRAILEED